MSGSKQTRIDPYQRKAEEIEKNINSLRKKIERGEKEGKKKLKSYKQRQKRRLSQMEDEMQEFEKENRQQLEKINTDFKNKLKEEKKDITNLMKEQKKELKIMINQENTRLKNKIKKINDKFESRIQKQEELANIWRERLSEELKLIKSNFSGRYNHQKFKTGAVAKIEQRLNNIESNMENEVYEAALATGQENYLESNELRYELEALVAQWETLLEEGETEVDQALKLAKNIKKHIVKLGGGQEEIDVNFWSDNKLEKVNKELLELKRELNQPEDLNTEDLIKIINQIKNSNNELENIFVEAVRNFESYVWRLDIQEVIATKLKDSAFKPVDHWNQYTDPRKANVLHMKNKMGEEIFFTIDGEKLRIDDTGLKPDLRGQRLKKLEQTLNQKCPQLNLGEFTCTPDCVDETAPASEKVIRNLKETKKEQVRSR